VVAEPGAFEAFYHGPLAHPWLLWAAAGLGTAVALARPGLDPGLRRYVAALGVLSGLDAWLTSAHVYGLGVKPPPFDGLIPFVFVYAGDLRFLLLVTCGTLAGGLAVTRRGLVAALALATLVPLATLPFVLWSTPRVFFLVYELAFFALAAGLARRHPNVRGSPWLVGLCRFVMLYYGLWAAADAILLATGSDLGFALRLLPNVLYYGGLIAAIAWLAPAREASP